MDHLIKTHYQPDQPIECTRPLIRFYKCAMVGLLLDWLDGNMKEDMLALTQRLCVLLEGMGKQALEKNIYSKLQNS